MLEKLLPEVMVKVYVDGCHPCCILPLKLKSNHEVVLNLSRKFELPLILGEFNIETTLSFNGTNFGCTIPYEAIYCIINAKTEAAYVFNSSLPEESLGEKNDESPSVKLRPKPSVKLRPKPHLRLVKPDKESD